MVRYNRYDRQTNRQETYINFTIKPRNVKVCIQKKKNRGAIFAHKNPEVLKETLTLVVKDIDYKLLNV